MKHLNSLNKTPDTKLFAFNCVTAATIRRNFIENKKKKCFFFSSSFGCCSMAKSWCVFLSRCRLFVLISNRIDCLVQVRNSFSCVSLIYMSLSFHCWRFIWISLQTDWRRNKQKKNTNTNNDSMLRWLSIVFTSTCITIKWKDWLHSLDNLHRFVLHFTRKYWT